MRMRIIAVFFAVLFVVGTVFAGENAKKAEKTTFMEMETPTGVIAGLDKVICPGHEPIPNVFPPCPIGSRTHIRGIVRIYTDSMDDPRASGTNIATENWNFDENFVGPMWGTYRSVVDNDSYWEGTWTGEWNGTSGVTRSQGHGGGSLEGLKIEYECTFPDASGGTCVGEILDPKGE